MSDEQLLNTDPGACVGFRSQDRDRRLSLLRGGGGPRPSAVLSVGTSSTQVMHYLCSKNSGSDIEHAIIDRGELDWGQSRRQNDVKNVICLIKVQIWEIWPGLANDW